MRDFRVLKMLDVFQSLLERFHIDYPMLRYMLKIRFVMDERRAWTMFDGSKEKKSPFIKSHWIYFLYSFILVFFVFGNAYMLQMSIMFGIALFILMTALIADFSPVMLDVRDRVIIGTKPMNERTIGMAKFIHLFIYLLQITGAFTMIPIIFMLFVQGFTFSLLFMIVLFLFVLFIIALTGLIYMFILKFFNGEHLKSMINYVQIIFAIGVIIGYQLIIRAYGFIDLNAAYEIKGWHFLLPPMWFAAPFELFLHKNSSTEIIILAILAFIIPVVAICFYYWLIPTFEANLQKLLRTTSTKPRPISFFEKLWRRLLCKTENSGTFFQFIYRITDREREFKLKIYPSLGIGLVLPFIFIFSEAGVRPFVEVRESRLYLCMYLMQIFIGIGIYTFQFSSSYKGSWIYRITGGAFSRELYQAVMKVFIVKLYLPMFIMVGVPYYLFFQQFHVIDLAVVFISGVVQALLSYKIAVDSEYPFSLSFDNTDPNEMTKAFLLMLLTIPFVVFHFLSTLLPFAIYGYFILLCVAAIFLWRYLLGSAT